MVRYYSLKWLTFDFTVHSKEVLYIPRIISLLVRIQIGFYRDRCPIILLIEIKDLIIHSVIYKVGVNDWVGLGYYV